MRTPTIERLREFSSFSQPIFSNPKPCSSTSFTLPSPFSDVHGRGIIVNRCAALFSKKSKRQQGVSKQHIRTYSTNSHSDCHYRNIDARLPFRSIRLEECSQQQGPSILVTKARQTKHLRTHMPDVKSRCTRLCKVKIKDRDFWLVVSVRS
jgi:hypothetical protein